MPQLQTKTPILGASCETSFSTGVSFALTCEPLAGARSIAAAQAAALASTTEAGMSLDPGTDRRRIFPDGRRLQEKIRGQREFVVRHTIPSRFASSTVSGVISIPTERTTISNCSRADRRPHHVPDHHAFASGNGSTVCTREPMNRLHACPEHCCSILESFP